MTPQELKASILQLAIQGKLVEHFDTDEAVVIQSSFVGDISEFFEIHDNWKWLSLKDVASVNTGLSFKKQDQRDSSNGTLRVLRGGNIGDDYKYHLFDDDVYVELDQFQTKYIQLLEGDIITPSVTSIEKICKTGYIDCMLPKVTAGGFVYIIRCLDRTIIEPKYLMYFIASAFNKEQCKPNIHKSGQAFYNLKKSGFVEQPICVPPLVEQKRIVAKIEELLPLIDRYEQAWSKLEDFNKRFPVDMQKSILQMAIQGRLVPQLPEEGTGEELFRQIQAEKQALIKAGKIKKEKPLPEIAEDEIPFDIPDTWKWIRLGSVIDMLSGFAFKSTDFKKEGQYRLLRGINLSVGNTRWDDTVFVDEMPEKCESFQILKGDVLIGLDRPWISEGIRVAIYNDDENAYLVQRVLRIRETTAITKEYIALLLRSNLFRNAVEGETTGISVPHISPGQVGNVVVPLPPFEEQKRIVAKLEEILPLCERLK